MRRLTHALRRYSARLLRGGESSGPSAPAADRRAGVRRYAERLWTLGLTTAVARRSVWGKLDALTEATVWIQDLLADQLSYPDDRPHLSFVEVLHRGTVVRASLPSFARPRDAVRTSWSSSDGSVTLALPAPLARRAVPLPEWWRAALDDFDIDLASVARQVPDGLLPLGSGIRPRETAPDIVREFKKNLRSAFDSVVESIDGNEFTLWLRPDGRTYAVGDDYRVPYAVGYCLPHRLRHHYLARAENALHPRQLGETPGVGLEVLVEPAGRRVARTLSHVFIESRLSGFVAGYHACKERLAEIPAGSCAHVEALEKRIWKSTEPHVFMMPLVNYHGSEPHHAPRVVAHWYVHVADLAPATVYRLAVRRARTNRVFFETLYVLYCDVVARELTRWLLESAAPPAAVNARLQSMSEIYGTRVAAEMGISGVPAGEDGIHAYFKTLEDNGFGHRDGLPWDQTLKVLWRKGMKALESVTIAWTPRRATLTERVQFDVLVRVFDNLRQEAQKRHDVRYFMGVFRDMAGAAGRIRRLIDEAGEHLGHRDHHAHLKAMDTLWYNDDYAVTCAYRGARKRIDPDGPWFVPAHDCCFTKEGQGMELGDCESGSDECVAEHWRRLYYVFQGPAGGMSPDGRGSREQATAIDERSAKGTPAAVRFTEFVERYGRRCNTNLWEWLKCSCAYGGDAPTVPAIVTILFLEDAGAVEIGKRLIERFERYERTALRGLAPAWQRSLRGIADLARERSRTITLDVDEDCILKFLIRGRGVPRLYAALRDKLENGVRAGTGMRQLADVLMAEEADELTGFRMHGVRIDHDPRNPAELAVAWVADGADPAGPRSADDREGTGREP